MSKAVWAEFTFPALNLWNMPKHNEIVRMINEYYYEHYKHLWEEDNSDSFPYTAVLKFDNEERIISGRIKL